MPGETTSTPTFTGVVNREFFIEPLGGPRNPQSYLDHFPPQIFTHDINSNLVSLLYALLGPAGIGSVRKDYLLSRLAIEANGLHTASLDEFYGSPLGFGRLIEESYDFVPQGLLTTQQWEQIQTSDASYRNRSIDFLKAVRAGGTVLGLTMAAKSGLNRPAEVIENYQILFDHYSDDPLGYEYRGATLSTEEVIVVPRQDVPTSSQQTVIISKEPNKGTFTLEVPIGATANSRTGNIAYNAIAFDVQSALEALPVIGKGNVRVTGGPAPQHPFVISFTGTLADRPLPVIIPTPDAGMTNAETERAIITVEVNRVGISADGETSSISSQDWYYANLAMEQIKPVTTILTPDKGPGLIKRQVPTLAHADNKQTFTQVLRFVTGLNTVHWPDTDSTQWIRAGLEKEAPLAQHAQRQHYSNFHNIAHASAYTDAALLDPEYETSKWPQRFPIYRSEQVGSFNKFERLIYPFLEGLGESVKFDASLSSAVPPNPPTIQTVVEDKGLINGIYPTEYQGLSGVTSIAVTNNFWSSLERVSGTDYLEIDLGSVQAVNLLSLQLVDKPLDISVHYDVLDNGPARKFIPVMLADRTSTPSVTSVGFTIGSNPWQSCPIYFTNSLGNQIFTRYLRIGFTRRLGEGNPFILGNGTQIPYSIQVKSLRVGRDLV